MVEQNFGSIDLILFIGSLMIAIIVGIYHGYKDRNKQNLDNFFFGSKTISPVMLGASMAVTFISAIAYISVPVMIYYQGTKHFWAIMACLLPAVPCALFVLPVLYRVQPTNIYEIFELRYNLILKKLCVCVYIIQQVAWMAIGIQMTGSALSLITAFSVTWSTAITVFICSIYSILGGLKAIVWVDTIQSLIMVSGGITLFIYGLAQVGGLGEAMNNLDAAGLNNFLDFTPNFNETYSFWSYTFSISFAYMAYVCTNQSMTQRLQSCKNHSDAKKTLVYCMIFTAIVFCIGMMNGIPMFSYFKGCDPIKSGEIKFADQFVPLMVVKLFKNFPGFAGLFVSSIYSGMLSTVSSGTNSVSMIIYEVFIRPNVRQLNDRKEISISRIISLIVFLTIFVLAVVISKLGSVAYDMQVILDSMFNAPMNSILICGIVFPWISNKGGVIGFAIGIFLNAWITIGQKFWGKTYKDFSYEDTTTENCTNFVNATVVRNSTVDMTSDIQRPVLADTLYQIPIPYLGFIGFFTTMSCALFFSFLTGHQKAKEADASLFVPIVSSRKFPSSVIKFFRFGVPEFSGKCETEEVISLRRYEVKNEMKL